MKWGFELLYFLYLKNLYHCFEYLLSSAKELLLYFLVFNATDNINIQIIDMRNKNNNKYITPKATLSLHTLINIISCLLKKSEVTVRAIFTYEHTKLTLKAKL